MSRSNKDSKSYILHLCCFISALIIIQSELMSCRPYGVRDYDDDDDIVEESADSPQSSKADDGNNDGYEETEPDEKYEETPADSESQAELERFFDDHLGASDRDGMDKENLPSNLVPIVSNDPTAVAGSELQGYTLVKNGIDRHDDYRPTTGYQTNSNYNNQDKHMLPYRGSASKKSILLGKQNIRPNENLDEEDEKIYVTRVNRKPFVIDQLGGYNPEEDFKAIRNDLDSSQPSEKLPEEKDKLTQRSDSSSYKDIDFVEPEDDSFANDNSETDDASFEADDPYINDRIEQSYEVVDTKPSKQNQNEDN